MAVMLGPWIDSTIVLGSSMIFALFARSLSATIRQKSIALVTIGASVGGIIATACGFAFPTLYFLDKNLFNAWLGNPLYFITIMGILAFCASAFGLLLANVFEHRFMVVEQLPFPIGELSYKMIAAQQNSKQAQALSLGFILSMLYSITLKYLSNIPKIVTIIPSLTYRWFTFPALSVALAEFPMLWSIGFIAGHAIAIPLGIGILAKNLICGPAHATCFTNLSFGDFLAAFAGGMVAYGALISFLTLPSAFKGFRGKNKEKKEKYGALKFCIKDGLQWIIFLLITGVFLHYFKFTILSQCYLLLGTALCTYQLIIIGGKSRHRTLSPLCNLCHDSRYDAFWL